MAIHIPRREFIAVLGGAAAAWPMAARAQKPDRVRRIGVLMSVRESDPEAQAWLGAFSEGLQKLGWTADRNIRLDFRWAAPFDAESRQRVAKELVALQPDLILSEPSDLPVQLPVKIQLTINLRTARALGLNVPSSFLLRADEMIE